MKTVIMMVARMVGMLEPAVTMNMKAKGIDRRAANRMSSPLCLSRDDVRMSSRARKKKKAVTTPPNLYALRPPEKK